MVVGSIKASHSLESAHIVRVGPLAKQIGAIFNVLAFPEF